MTMRPVSEDEVELVHDMIVELAEFEQAKDQVTASPEQLRAALFADQPALFCDIIETEAGDVAGFGIWFLNYSTWTGTHGVYLEDLYIRPEYRSGGLGAAYLKHLARICIERGYHRLQWWVLDWNEPAISFYTKIGAQLMSEWTVMRVDGETLNKLAQPL